MAESIRHHCIRSLAAANGAVRRNALQLFVDAFPLQDPDAPQARHCRTQLRRMMATAPSSASVAARGQGGRPVSITSRKFMPYVVLMGT